MKKDTKNAPSEEAFHVRQKSILQDFFVY